MRNLAIGEPVERLTLLLHSLYGTNLRENLSLWNSFTTRNLLLELCCHLRQVEVEDREASACDVSLGQPIHL